MYKWIIKRVYSEPDVARANLDPTDPRARYAIDLMLDKEKDEIYHDASDLEYFQLLMGYFGVTKIEDLTGKTFEVGESNYIHVLNHLERRIKVGHQDDFPKIYRQAAMSLAKFELPIFEGFSDEVVMQAFQETWNHGLHLDWIEQAWKKEFMKLVSECSNGEVELIKASNPNLPVEDWFFFLVKGSEKKGVESHYYFDSPANIFKFASHTDHWR
jgi:hypothetical protein